MRPSTKVTEAVGVSSPSTVRKALAVRTGMVNREHVYMPSSASVTSLRLMVSSADVAWTSSIRLSRRATRQRERERVIYCFLLQLIPAPSRRNYNGRLCKYRLYFQDIFGGMWHVGYLEITGM